MVQEAGIARWNEIVTEISSKVNMDYSPKGHQYDTYTVDKNVVFNNVPNNLKDYVISQQRRIITDENGVKREAGAFYHSMLGQLYEKTIMSIFASQGLALEMRKEVKSAYKALFETLQSTGSKVANQHLRGQGYVIYDMIWDGQSNENNDKIFSKSEDGFLQYNNRPITISQQIELEYDKENLKAVQVNEKDILSLYRASNLYGFGAKKYNINLKSITEHKFTTATGLQATINKELQNQTKNWTMKSAWLYTQKEVNRHVLDIVGANSVGQIFGNAFLWTSDFVNNSFFYMNVEQVSSDHSRDKEAQEKYLGKTIKPTVVDGNVYFRYLSSKAVFSVRDAVRKYTKTENGAKNEYFKIGAKIEYKPS